MIGPPRAGKSMLAERLPSILPSLSPEEMRGSELKCRHALRGVCHHDDGGDEIHS